MMAWSFLRRFRHLWQLPARAATPRTQRPCFQSSIPSRKRDARGRTRLEVEPLESRELLSANFYVAPNGNDWNSGTINQPFATLQRALDAVQPGDIINLRNGVYNAGATIDINNVTIQSYPGEWAVLQLPNNDPQQRSVLRYNFNTQGGMLKNLEITGGYYYGVMCWDWWDPNWDAGSTHVGASGITIDGCKIHDTGADGVKLSPGANDVTIENSEIFNTGRVFHDSANGIVNNDGDRMHALHNYIHDTPGIGILTTEGTTDSVIDGNLIMNTAGAGITDGFYADLEWMKPGVDPNLYTAINEVVRNNVIVNAAQAGVGIYAAQNPQVYNNTIVNAASQAQAPIQFGGVDIWVPNSPTEQHVESVNPLVVNNVITVAAANDTRMVDIRYQSYTGTLTLDHNIYDGQDLLGVRFINRNVLGDVASEYYLSGWQAQNGLDPNSFIADPQLDAQYHLTAGSPAIDAGMTVAGLQTDYDGDPRDTIPDIGADEYVAGSETMTPPAPFGAPTLAIAAGEYHGFENTTVVVTVVRQGSLADTLTVGYATLDGAAKAGVNYTAVQGTLTFAPGQQSMNVSVPLLHDPKVTGDQDFLFTLANPTTNGMLPVRLGNPSTVSITIDDLEVGATLNYRTMFVSNAGSDVTGDGSMAKPWKSLQFAADNVGPGDYVIVEPGQYQGFHLTTSGKADATITFHAMSGVVINDPDPVLNEDGIDLEGASNVTVEGFEVDGMPRAGIRSVLNTDAVIRNNRIDQSGMWGILTGWSDHLLIEGNDISHTVQQHGIYVSNSSDHGVVRNNLVWSNHDSGIQFNADATLPGDGIHSYNTIEGNVLYDNGAGGGAAINLDGFQDGVVDNNLLYDNHATGIVLYQAFAAAGSTNNQVVNNTVIQAPDGRWALLLDNGSGGNTVLNNILLSENPNTGSMTVDSSSLPALSDFNIVQDSFQTNEQNTNFAGWKAFSGQDLDSFFATVNDLFVDPANNDYHLKDGSPAIGAGTAPFAPTVDIYQHPRLGGVDIGAVQHGTFAPQVQFGWANYVGYQTGGLAVLDVQRAGDTTNAVTVHVATADGTAIAGVDYMPVSGTLTFQPGQTTLSVLVQLINPAKLQPSKTLTVTLSDPSGVVQLGGQATTTLTLVSDQTVTPGTFSFTQSAYTVSDTVGMVTITVQRTGGSDGTVTVDYSTGPFTPPPVPNWNQYHTLSLYPPDNDGVATTPDDYLPASGTLTFGPGETSKTFSVPIVNDPWYEGDEAFLVKLSNPTNGAQLDATATAKVRIQTDKVAQPGQFQFDMPNYSMLKGAVNVPITITRTGGDNVAASVSIYQSAGSAADPSLGLAWGGAQYTTTLPNFVTFAPGETAKTFYISAIDDHTVTGDKAFTVELYSPSNGATLGNVASTVVKIADIYSDFEFQSLNGANTFIAKETDGAATITVLRRGATAQPASVTVQTVAWGSAQPGVNYLPVNVTLQFAPGETSKTVQVPVLDDHIVTPTLTVGISMSNPVGATLGSGTWSLQILNTDVAAMPGQLALSAATYSVMKNAGSLQVTVQRTGGSDGVVTVNYATSSGASGYSSSQTAWGGSNYGFTSGTLTFQPGETSKVINIPINYNSNVSVDKVFTIKLSNAAGGATLGAITQAVVTIQESDSAIQFQSTTITTSENAGYALITVVRIGYTGNSASVDLGLTGATAKAGTNFVMPSSWTITFAPGETVKTFKIALIDDHVKTGTLWIGLMLKNFVGAKQGYNLWANLYEQDSD